MKKVIILFLLLATGGIAHAQTDTLKKSYLDTALLGTWKIEDPAMAKVVTTSRDYFLRAVVHFKDRQLFEVDKERHEWSWSFNEETQELEIADMEELLVQSYIVKDLDATKLVLLMGKQEIVFHRVQ